MLSCQGEKKGPNESIMINLAGLYSERIHSNKTVSASDTGITYPNGMKAFKVKSAPGDSSWSIYHSITERDPEFL